jgi:hypothetical protein
VAVRDEVVHRLGSASLVVDEDGIDIDADRWTIHEDDRGSGVDLARQVPLVAAGRYYDKRVGLSGRERVDQCALTLGVLVDAPSEDQDVPAARDILERAVQRG